jgi:hypothetical protein
VSDTQHTEGTDEQQWTGGYHHIVVLMLENRSFDHVLGFPYAGGNSVSPAGRPFDGLSGQESNTDGSGKAVAVFKIQSTSNNACLMPAANPGEGYSATSSQLFGTTTTPTPPQATNQGFVTDLAYTHSPTQPARPNPTSESSLRSRPRPPPAPSRRIPFSSRVGGAAGTHTR